MIYKMRESGNLGTYLVLSFLHFQHQPVTNSVSFISFHLVKWVHFMFFCSGYHNLYQPLSDFPQTYFCMIPPAWLGGQSKLLFSVCTSSWELSQLLIDPPLLPTLFLVLMNSFPYCASSLTFSALTYLALSPEGSFCQLLVSFPRALIWV